MVRALLVLGFIWFGAWAGLTWAEQLRLAPVQRIICGFVGCWVAALLIVVGAVAGRARRAG